MGRIIRFAAADAPALAAAWAVYKLASRPEHGRWRTALAIEDRLIECTVPEKTGLRLLFSECSGTHEIAGSDIERIAPELATFLLARTMPEGMEEVALALEDAEFEYLKSLLPKVVPVPATIRHFVRLEEILNDDKLSEKTNLAKMRAAKQGDTIVVEAVGGPIRES